MSCSRSGLGSSKASYFHTYGSMLTRAQRGREVMGADDLLLGPIWALCALSATAT